MLISVYEHVHHWRLVAVAVVVAVMVAVVVIVVAGEDKALGP